MQVRAILERTGYKLDVTTGQRKYGGPPPNWEGDPPGNGCEVFCGKIPRDLYEDELIPLFEKCGTIWDLRLMMDPMTGLNRCLINHSCKFYCYIWWVSLRLPFSVALQPQLSACRKHVTKWEMMPTQFGHSAFKLVDAISFKPSLSVIY